MVLLSANPNAINLLEQNTDKIEWEWLAKNTNGIKLLEQNEDKIHWGNFSKNPNIFQYDYQAIKDRMYNSGLCEELMTVMFHPDNTRKFAGWVLKTWCQMGLEIK